MALDDVQTGLGHRMLGDKNCAAVLIRKDGSLKCADLLGDLDDLLFVKSDQRPEYRQCAHFIGDAERCKGLGRHLADALAGDETQALSLSGQLLRDAHHIAAHDDSQFIVRALLIDIELDLGEVDIVQPDRARVSGHLARQVDDLLQRALAGIGRRVEIDRIQLHASLCDHISRDRGIDAAGQKQHCLAAYADRQSAGSRNNVGIDVDLLPDLNVQHDLGLVHIYGQIGAGHEDRLADLLVDTHGIERIFLVQSSCVNLESGLFGRIFLLHESRCRFSELLDGHDRHFLDGADAGNTEHAAERLGNFTVFIVREALHEDSSVGPVHGKIALAGLERMLDLAHQRFLKDVAVLALDADLCILDQKRLISHIYPLTLIPARDSRCHFNVWYIFSKREPLRAARPTPA